MTITDAQRALPDELLTPTAASEFLKITVVTLQRWRTEGCGPPYCKIGRRVTYRRSDLNEFVNGRVVQSTAQTRSGVHQ